jgi:hypothetical protein
MTKLGKIILLLASFLIFLIYIARRESGYVGGADVNQRSDLYIFLVSGVLDGLVAVAVFLILVWAFAHAKKAISNGQNRNNKR